MGAIYRHYKGGLYTIICYADNTEEEQSLVVYKGTDGCIWARPTDMFFQEVEHEGKIVPRFEFLAKFD